MGGLLRQSLILFKIFTFIWADVMILHLTLDVTAAVKQKPAKCGLLDCLSLKIRSCSSCLT